MHLSRKVKCLQYSQDVLKGVLQFVQLSLQLTQFVIIFIIQLINVVTCTYTIFLDEILETIPFLISKINE
jgi:hypothetical protein